MKKIILFIVGLVSVFSLAQCDKPLSQPEPEPVLPLRLETYPVGYYFVSSNCIVHEDAPVCERKILSGNGGYEIVYPEKITAYKSVDSNGNGVMEDTDAIEPLEIEYSDDIFKVYVNDENEIVVEAGKSMGAYYKAAIGVFSIKDQKGQEASFGVLYGKGWA